jgi:acyl-CoA thioester hydrolase
MKIPEKFHYIGERRVEWVDTDSAGIVHFTSFLRYVESVEHAFWRSIGLSCHMGEGDEQHGWPRLSVSCDYTKPVRFEQLLNVGIQVLRVGNTTLQYGFWIFDDKGIEDGLVAVGELTIIHVGMDPGSGGINKLPIPEDIRERLKSL